jgi:hypothetical protein
MAADDTCQIVALLGRALLGWGTTPPDISQFVIFYRPDGDGYVEQCPWAELGIEPLPPGKPNMDNMRFFTAPRFADGGLSAEIAFVTKLVARDKKGREMPPYINQVNLTVTKVEGRWALTSQRQGPVT